MVVFHVGKVCQLMSQCVEDDVSFVQITTVPGAKLNNSVLVAKPEAAIPLTPGKRQDSFQTESENVGVSTSCRFDELPECLVVLMEILHRYGKWGIRGFGGAGLGTGVQRVPVRMAFMTVRGNITMKWRTTIAAHSKSGNTPVQKITCKRNPKTSISVFVC